MVPKYVAARSLLTSISRDFSKLYDIRLLHDPLDRMQWLAQRLCAPQLSPSSSGEIGIRRRDHTRIGIKGLVWGDQCQGRSWIIPSPCSTYQRPSPRDQRKICSWLSA